MDVHNVEVLVQVKWRSSNTQCYEPKMYKKNCATPKKPAANSATYAQGMGKMCYIVAHVIKTTFTILNILARPMPITFHFKVN
jgi:hypothetical protein